MEGDQHEDAVARAGQILENRGFERKKNSDIRGKGGFAFPLMIFENGLRVQYTTDLYFVRGYSERLILEVDGQKAGQGHNTEHAKNRDRRRDQLFWDYFGIPTARLWTSELVGKGAFDDALIMKEINWQVNYWREHGHPPLK